MRDLQEIREQQGLSAYRAAQLIGISLQRLRSIEAPSTHAVDLRVLAKMVRVYRLSWGKLGRLIDSLPAPEPRAYRQKKPGQAGQ